MIIRQENEKDFSTVYELVKVAFQTAAVTSGQEQELVGKLRNSANYIPELALVAEDNGELLGHIMLTRTLVVDGDTKNEVLFLGPVSVVKEYRKRGIGSALMVQSLKIAGELGYKAVVLVGDPAYYHRFGFKTSANWGIRHVLEIPAEFVMACELVPNALANVRGVFDC
jgi:putative acetyltransferase